MTDHLPECPWADRGYAFPCICDRLRSCEQRVLRDAVNSDAVRGAIRIAEQRTLDAARDAVKNVPCPEGYEAKGCSHWDDALAAIDLLRGES